MDKPKKEALSLKRKIDERNVPEGHTARLVAGHPIKFPGTPYPVQMPFMERVVRALDSSENALLEAPTGSGKTLALICSSMQWMEDTKIAHFERLQAEFFSAAADYEAKQMADVKEESPDPALETKPEDEDEDETPAWSLWRYSCGSPMKRFRLKHEDVKQESADSDDCPGFEETRSGKKIKRDPSVTSTHHLHDCQGLVYLTDPLKIQDEPPKNNDDAEKAGIEVKNESDAKILQQIFASAGDGEKESAKPPEPPRIFYATRTHSQISQIVKEVRRTCYEPRTVILGSKRHYCIHAQVRKEKDVDAACSRLLKDKEHRCKYYLNTLKMRPPLKWQVEDIEELQTSCRKKKLCPYYVSRKRMDYAEFVLSPYNYLISPSIRSSMAIDLKGAGIILDEAHNIEDVCRDAASFESDLESILVAKKSFEKKRLYYETYNQETANWVLTLETAFAGLMNFMAQFLPEKEKHYLLRRSEDRRAESLEMIVGSEKMMEMMEEAGFGSDDLVNIKEAYNVVKGLEEPKSVEEDLEDPAEGSAKNQNVDVTIGMHMVGQLVMVLGMMYKGPAHFTEAFKLCIKAENVKQPGVGARRRSIGPSWDVKISIWCLNAAVSFSEVASACRSVILTSGTLAPMDSFASELGVQFNFKLESRHVVDMNKQVWAATCSVDPGGNQICCTYSEMQNPRVWDRIGAALLQWVMCIPDGVLVFMPSFRVLSQLLDRWKATNTLDRLENTKPVFLEGRSGSGDFEEGIQEYYKAVDSGRGALFFGVCRGKASEGINFSDGYARSVVMIGIPFPALKDPKVQLKKDYNTKWSSQLGLCSGNMWYSQQAFRALNQGIGRCIRHKNDYGAILLLDSRYKSDEKLGYVSKWVRSNIKKHDCFGPMVDSVRNFFTNIAEIKGEKLKRSEICVKPEPGKSFLVGFENLVKETIEEDIELFKECISSSGIFVDEEEKTREEAERSLMDCLYLFEKHPKDLDKILKGWRHRIPAALAALLALREIEFDHPANRELRQMRELTAAGPIQGCLEELCGIYRRSMEVVDRKAKNS